MKIARYWTRADAEAMGAGGETVRARARGWSDESLNDARVRALEIARRVAERIAGGWGEKQRYPYGDRPLPEPVLRELEGALVTRNAYGALVLNASQMMFIDIDAESGNSQPATGLSKMLGSLFGKTQPAAPAADPMTQKLDALTRRHGLSGRLYKTAAGYRVLITSAPFAPGDPAAEAVLREYGSDPLYVRLCKMQESFRARLTPKPWRCGMRNPPVEFPFETASEQTRYADWEREYHAKSGSFATCRFISALGGAPADSRFTGLIDYHDRETKSTSALRLA